MSLTSLTAQQTEHPDYYEGIVVDNNDPKRQLRVRVNIPKIFEGDKEMLPWVTPKLNSPYGQGDNFGAVHIPSIGSRVKVRFQNNDPHYPVYEGFSSTANIQLSEEFTQNYPDRVGGVSPEGVTNYHDTKTGEWLWRHPTGAGVCITAEGRILIHAPKGLSLVSKENVSVDIQGGNLLIQAEDLLAKLVNMVVDASSKVAFTCNDFAALATNISTKGNWAHDGKLDATDVIKSKGISLPDHKHKYTDDGHPMETDPPSA